MIHIVLSYFVRSDHDLFKAVAQNYEASPLKLGEDARKLKSKYTKNTMKKNQNLNVNHDRGAEGSQTDRLQKLTSINSNTTCQCPASLSRESTRLSLTKPNALVATRQKDERCININSPTRDCFPPTSSIFNQDLDTGTFQPSGSATTTPLFALKGRLVLPLRSASIGTEPSTER